MPVEQIEVFPLTLLEAAAVRDVLESDWKAARVAFASELAGAYTFAQLVRPDELLQVLGPKIVQRYRDLSLAVKQLHETAQLLDRGKAVLVPWRNVAQSNVINIAVVKREDLPKGGELGAWPVYVLAAVGVIIAGAVVFVAKFDHDLQMARMDLEDLRLQAWQGAQESIKALQQKDPAAAARILDASSRALQATRAAATDPRGWLDRMFGTIESAVSPLVWIAGLYLVSRMMERSGGYSWTRKRLAA